MAQSSWPFENIDTSETQFSQWARNIGEGVKTGALNELEVFADSTGMQVKVRSGQAMVRGHYYQSTAQETLTVTAADLTNPRIDTVIIELDPSANSIVLKVIAGSPAAVPSPEPLVQTDAGVYQFKLAEVLIDAAATTIAAGKVTDSRTYLEALLGTLDGSQITGEITVATIDGDRIINQIDTATIPGTNVTGNIAASQINGELTSATINQADVDIDLSAKTAAYTIALTDRGSTITLDGTFDLTAPSATFAAGDRVDFVNIGSGVITFVGSGVTISSKDSAVTLATQYSAASLVFTSASAAVLIGDIA